MRLLPLLVCLPLVAHGYDAFDDTRSPSRFAIDGGDGLTLTLKGNARLAWRDIEGQGGVNHDSLTDTRTIGTRSAHVALEGIDLAFRIESDDGLAFYSALSFDDRGAKAQAAWLDGRWHLFGDLALHVEAGLQTPFIAVDDLTARAPLTSRIYWGQSEIHLVSELSAAMGWLKVWGGLSVAMMRPLASVTVNDATDTGTIAVLGYGDAESFSGNLPIYGGRLGVGVTHLTLDVFGYMGALSADEGTDVLVDNLPNFRLLPGYNPDDKHQQDDTFWWGGGRLDAQWAGLEARVEVVRSAESLLRRTAGYLQLGYVYTRTADRRALFRTFEPRMRIERYRIEGAADALTAHDAFRVRATSKAQTWDFDVITFALGIGLYRDLLRLNIEHSRIDEDNGAPSVDQANEPFKNNETTAQLELRF